MRICWNSPCRNRGGADGNDFSCRCNFIARPRPVCIRQTGWGAEQGGRENFVVEIKRYRPSACSFCLTQKLQGVRRGGGGKTLSAGWNFAARQLAVLFANKNGKVSGTDPSPRFSYSVHSIQPAARFPPRKTVADGRQRYILTIQSFRPPVPIRNTQAGKKTAIVNRGSAPEPVRTSSPIRKIPKVAAAYNAPSLRI